MTIDLEEVKRTANRQATYATVELLNDWPVDVMLALIEVVEAAEELRQRVVFTALGPPIVPTDIGLRMFHESTDRLAAALAPFKGLRGPQVDTTSEAGPLPDTKEGRHEGRAGNPTDHTIGEHTP